MNTHAADLRCGFDQANVFAAFGALNRCFLARSDAANHDEIKLSHVTNHQVSPPTAQPLLHGLRVFRCLLGRA